MMTMVGLSVTLLALILPQGLGHVPDDEKPIEDDFQDDPNWDDDMDPEMNRRRYPGMDPDFDPDMDPDMDPEMYPDMDPETRHWGRRRSMMWYNMFSTFCRRFRRYPMEMDMEDESDSGEREDVEMQLREECNYRRQDPRGMWPTFELMRLIFSNPELSDRFEMMSDRYRYRDY